MSKHLLQRLQALRMLILDVDGTLTDGCIGINEANSTYRFSVKDGMGVRILGEEGLIVGIISNSPYQQAIQKRAKTVGITRCYVGDIPKDTILKQWCAEESIPLEEIAVIGDDVNDLPLFACCGHSACPADAVPRVSMQADIVLSRPGGQGCIREWVDNYFLIARHWHTL